jgi:methionyl-tRNA synthetase
MEHHTNSQTATCSPFYITTPIFYPNGKLHIGQTYTATVADVFARMSRMLNNPTYFLTGVDENSLKIEKTAEQAQMEIMPFLDDQTEKIQDLFKKLHIKYDQYIRTTDPLHHKGVIEMWKRMEQAGDIYEGVYEGLYCVGCEGFKTEKDLIDGKCPDHGTVPETISEKNYFFKLSAYSEKVAHLIRTDAMLITPTSRKNEILAVLEAGLQDIPFSRPYKGQPNAILVPGDDTQSIYVWCDALTNYVSALGFGSSEVTYYDKFWPATVQIMGKDILRFHAAIWPAMLLSAGLHLPRQLLVHGLMLSGGKKMSKTVGNVIDPEEIISLVGFEGLRFYFAHDIPLTSDGEISKDLIIASYNAHLANGIGNLTNRLLKMMISYEVMFNIEKVESTSYWLEKKEALFSHLEKLDLTGYTDYIWKGFAAIDKEIQETEPFKLFKTDPEKAREIISGMMLRFYTLVYFSQPILPKATSKIIECIQNRQMPENPLFVKI